MIFDTKILLFRSLYLFVVLFAVMGHGTVLGQDVPEIDSLALAPADSIAASIFPSDSIAADSLNIVPKKESAFKTRVIYKAADSVKFDMRTNWVYLYKETQVNYDDIELKAYKTEFDMTTKIIYASGGRDSIDNYIEIPEFKQRSTSYVSDSMSYNFDTQRGIIHRIVTQQGEGYLHATKAKRYPDGHIHMGGGKYTTCDHDHPHFYLFLKEAVMIPGDMVAFRYAHMVLLDVPLLPLFLPFGFFPQTNKDAVSGIIPPTIGMEISRGLSLERGGYYIAFKDHLDAQILGDIYSTGSWRTNLSEDT